MGGQTVRTMAIDEILLEGISEGIPLRQLCRIHGISKSAVYNWRKEDAEFDGRFAQARARGFHEIAEEALEIADDGTNDWVKREKPGGTAGDDVLNGEHVQRSKLRIETRLKLLAKWDPKNYGDKTILSNDPENPITPIAEPLDIARRVAFLLKKGEKAK